jgi:dihydroorotase
MPLNQLTITAPDDWHLHFRDGEVLHQTVAATARCFKRCIVMPNLQPPITNRVMALAYRERILEAAPKESDINPLMTLYLTDKTSAEDISDAFSLEIPAAKLYPAGATTNSDKAVGDIEHLYPVFERMSELGMLLLVHGEVTETAVDIFDREKQFIDQSLTPIHQRFPDLKIVLEHITTGEAVDFVSNASANLAATITPQHLLLNRNDLLVGGIRPHNYCLPVLKRSTHQDKLRKAAVSGSHKFFLGTDSAPHSQTAKENACGCAGCYSAWAALELYAEAFDQLNAMDKLEGFASYYGADFYGLARNTTTITLVREQWTMPESLPLGGGQQIVPLLAGSTLQWRVQ